MRLSLVYLAVFAAPSLVHGRRHRCSRSTPLSSAAATPDTSSGWTSTPSASVSPSSVIIASSSTPGLSDSSAVSPSASASTPSSSVPTTFSTGTTPAGTPSLIEVSSTPSSTDVSSTPSSTDVSSTPSSADVSATPSSSLSSPSLGTMPSASPVSSESTTPVSSTVISSSSSSSAPAATPTAWQLQSSGANSGFAGSYLLGNNQNHNAPYFFSPQVTVPDYFEKLNFYIEPGTGHLFWVTDGVNNRYQFFTSYDEFEENGEYYYNVNPGYVSCYDMAVGVGSIHTQPLVCSRTGASFSCSANTPGGVFSHFMIRSSQTSSYMISFGSSIPSGWQEVTFAAVDIY
ncbi:unnamed protein product [Clonostachys solani]|uniref:Uncharacterized protein n=1 Tax=Clonostachys solani TaxID=160281 RepID=A0A9N9ZE16_9HYPO|nr:unnamed protein product [Clonostachys solani]